MIQGGYKNIRLKHYDYHTGWFFVTNQSNFSRNYFDEKISIILHQALENLCKSSQGVTIDHCVIMPNHVHIILVFKNSSLTLSEFWRRFKAKTTYEAKKIGFKDVTLWQKNYFEHVIRSEKALIKIREYITKNPYVKNISIPEIYRQTY